MSPLQAIVEALEKPQAATLVISALQPVAGGPIALASGYRQLAAPSAGARPRRPGGSSAGAHDSRHLLRGPWRHARARARHPGGAALPGACFQPSRPTDTIETVPGLVVDLADLAGVPLEPETPLARGARRAIGPSASPSPRRPDHGEEADLASRRSDPEEARRRRQRLLLRAMQNMGVGPLSGPPPTQAARHAVSEPGKPSGRPPASPAEEELRRAFDATPPRARVADSFERLGVPRSATRDQVKSAYFQLAKQLHPDRFGSAAFSDLAPGVKDLFAHLNEAYEILSDDRKRADYLARSGAAGLSAAQAAEREGAAVDFQKAEACARTRDFAKARASTRRRCVPIRSRSTRLRTPGCCSRTRTATASGQGRSRRRHRATPRAPTAPLLSSWPSRGGSRIERRRSACSAAR